MGEKVAKVLEKFKKVQRTIKKFGTLPDKIYTLFEILPFNISNFLKP